MKKVIGLIFSVTYIFSFSSIIIYAQQREIKEMSLEELMNLTIITAGKTEEKITDIPASAIVITRDDIEKYGYKNLDEVLENVPGFFGIDISFEGKVFGVRGFWTETANSILLLINGVRQERHESDGAVYISPTVAVEAIDRIEIVRGPMAVLYGEGAFFGVINIITNDAVDGSRISFGIGNNNTVKLAARTSYKGSEISAVINAGYYNTYGPDFPLSDMSTKNLSDYTPFTSTKNLWGSETKYFGFSGSYNNFYANVTFNQLFKNFFLLYLPTSSDGSYTNITYSSIALGYQASLSDNLSVDAKMSYRLNATHGGFGWFTPSDKENIGADHNDREDYEIELTSFYNPIQEIKLTCGINYREKLQEQLEGVYAYQNLVYRLNIIDPIRNSAAFMQADINLNEWINLIAGIRLVKPFKYSVFYQDITKGLEGNALKAEFSKDRIELIPRLAAVFHFDDNNILKLMYGKAINQPSFFKVVAEATSDQPPLVPEFINTIEINYLANLPNLLLLNGSVFFNECNGLIVNQPLYDPYTGTWSSGYFSNSGKLRTIGTEITVRFLPLNNFTLDVSATFQNTQDLRDKYSNIEVGYSPKILGYIKTCYSVNDDVSLALFGRYIGPMETLWDYTLGNNGERIAQKVDGYFVASANLRWNNFPVDQVYFSFNINNVFNTKFLYPSYTFNSYWADKGIAGNKIEILATLGYNF